MLQKLPLYGGCRYKDVVQDKQQLKSCNLYHGVYHEVGDLEDVAANQQGPTVLGGEDQNTYQLSNQSLISTTSVRTIDVVLLPILLLICFMLEI